MPTPYSSEDLGRLFESRVLTRGRSLVLIGAVEVALDGETITGKVEDRGVRRTARLTPRAAGQGTVFESRCSCRAPACIHLAAAGFAALDRFPALRRPVQKSFIDSLAAGGTPEAQRLAFDVSPGMAPFSCFVTTAMVGERSGRVAATTPHKILADAKANKAAHDLARLLGGVETSRVGVPADGLEPFLDLAIRSGLARWGASGRMLMAGEERAFASGVPPALPPKSGVLFGEDGRWYVDGLTGAVGRMTVRATAPVPMGPPARGAAKPSRRREPIALPALASEQIVSDATGIPVLRLCRLQCPDETGRMQVLDALTLDFDYGGALIDGDDERQLLRVSGRTGVVFVRRDLAAEAQAFEQIRPDGFVQMRVADPKSAKGRRVMVFRGRDTGEQWHRFIGERMPALEAMGFRCLVEGEFGPRLAGVVGALDVRVADALSGDGPGGRFSLDFGIEIEGVRRPLLPILTHLMNRGGIEAARIVGDDLITSLEDGRVVKLPAERIRRLLAVMGDLIDAAGREPNDTLELPEAEAPTLIELEEVLTTRWQDAQAIEATIGRFRAAPEIVPVTVPASFRTALRPYQQQGVDWLQHLAGHGLGGFLADDMGLGKTAQTIAHLVVEEAAGRLAHPALIVVPTSLITNWTAELAKFAPHLRVVVLHGLDRHQRRTQLGQVHVVVTTYTVLSRDVAEMRELPWHVVVLDEAQAIKSPEAKATRAVCQLQAHQRLCLSGTPIENNLDELWSQFAFLMPGLLGDRKGFTKRFRTPIEKRGDDIRRIQLVRRIQPFILRRTKAEVATELPPKHTILRRITLAPEQRELYETIRVTMHERVREQIAERSLAQSRIVVLDALLKLRQVCCDPRLVKLAAAQEIKVSSKLDDLMEMLGEMIPEGRRVLLFSQFTSMLDLIKPRLTEAGIRFVELRGDTRDRAEPVRSFEASEVPLFLISLKAGGRGLNLVSADTVVHYDPWWNPAVEDQASDRAHRIGQTKSVFVYKMIAADTVEERILELQQRKAELANLAFTEASDVAQLDFNDVEFLFGQDPERQAA